MNKRTQWEYKIEDWLSVDEMHQQGKDGWELVSVVAVKLEHETDWTTFFKRPLIQEDESNNP